MDLNTINTVSDLINANSTVDTNTEECTLDSVYDQVCELPMDDAVRLTIRIVESLAIYHQQIRNELVDTESERACIWAHDEALLASALGILNNVQLD